MVRLKRLTIALIVTALLQACAAQEYPCATGSDINLNKERSGRGKMTRSRSASKFDKNGMLVQKKEYKRQ